MQPPFFQQPDGSLAQFPMMQGSGRIVDAGGALKLQKLGELDGADDGIALTVGRPEGLALGTDVIVVGS